MIDYTAKKKLDNVQRVYRVFFGALRRSRALANAPPVGRESAPVGQSDGNKANVRDSNGEHGSNAGREKAKIRSTSARDWRRSLQRSEDQGDEYYFTIFQPG